MHFGIISPPVSGHIHPFGALGRELIERGHRATLIHMEDVRARGEAEGLEFYAIGATDHPKGSLPVSLDRLGKLDGFPALRFTIEAVRKTSQMFFRDAPAAIEAAGIEALLVDQTEPAGGTIAEHLRIPFVTICNALNLNEEPGVPPPFTPWHWGTAMWMKSRNLLGYQMAKLVMSPVRQVVSAQRRKWGLPQYQQLERSFSPLAQISQLPSSFDYPRRCLPATFHYVGPLRKAKLSQVSFPWTALDGRPIIYSSLGTLQNGREHVFRMFAEACSTLPVQLVIAGLESRDAAGLPGNPLVVAFAPQLEVIAKASLTLTHGGLNTVLDSLLCGVPIVAMPINYEQPAIAERVRWTGTGEVVQFRGLTAIKLRAALSSVLQTGRYAERAREFGMAIQRAGGVQKAASIIETALNPH